MDLPRKSEEIPAKTLPEESKKRGRKKAKMNESDQIGISEEIHKDGINQVTPPIVIPESKRKKTEKSENPLI